MWSQENLWKFYSNLYLYLIFQRIEYFILQRSDKRFYMPMRRWLSFSDK